MGVNPRLVRGVACLCLPTLVVVGLAVRFVAVDVPRLVANERERVAALCEQASRNLLEHPESADFTWRRGTGVTTGAECYGARFPADLTWKDWPSAGRAKTREKWGWFNTAAGRLVWVRDTRKDGDDATVYGRETDLAERDWAGIVYLFGGFSLFVLVGITLVGVRFFIDYVKARDDFMAATAHDLTTPLVGMRYMIGIDDGEAKVLNERMIRLVENIKDFMRLGGRRREPRCEPFDLLAAYREAYALFREDYRDLFDGKDVAVSVPDRDSPLRALGDETLTVQILWNLLGNDLKYAAPFGPVRVAFRVDGARIVADFIDEGPGLTRHQRARAFDRYYRAQTALESGKGGFGIGLCTAREFAQAMGGSLTVRANEPRGCIFTLVLPRA